MYTIYLVKTKKPNVFERFDKLAVMLYGTNVLPNNLLTAKIAESQQNWEKYLFDHIEEPTKQPSWIIDLQIRLMHTESGDFVITETEIPILIKRAKEYDLDIQVVDKSPKICVYNEHESVNVCLTEQKYHTGIRYKITYGQAIDLPCISDVIECPLFMRIANAIYACNNNMCVYSYSYCYYDNDVKIPGYEKEKLIKELQEHYNIRLKIVSDTKQ